ncbi:unnamed protein product [Phytomonas sp. EM1]|nr:unnamed protein product [Phytomonas sp. EM1]|eukprot:CCW65471.1 unnamed protein product [Phytomonas sp. isolate EM1]
MSSSEYACNDVSVTGSTTIGSGRYASVTSMKQNTCSIEIVHDTILDSKESKQTLQNIKGPGNHGSAVREGEERPNLIATSAVGRRSDPKSYAPISNNVKYIYKPHPHIQRPPSMTATNHQFNTIDGFKGSASFSSLPLQTSGSRIINANNPKSTLRYTPVHGDLSDSTLVSSTMEPRGVTRPMHNLMVKSVASTGQPTLVPSAHSASLAPPAASISNSMGGVRAEWPHSAAVGGARHPVSIPRRSDTGGAFIPERPLAEEGSDPPRGIPPGPNSATAARGPASRGGDPDDAASHRLATGIGPRLEGNGPDGGKTPLPPPETHSLAVRSDVATAVPSELTLIGAQRPKPPPRPRQPEAGTLPEDIFRQPTRALSVQLVALYKYINARYWHRRRMEAPGPKYNNGFDDKDGHYIVLPGEEILNRFTVQEVLGKGSFGTVIRCYDEKRHEAVALKITRHGFNFREQAKLELDILLKLNENANLNHLVVKLLKVFDWQGHLVLMFELLSFNLYQLIKCTRYKGVCLDLVCKFAYQLVCTLRQLEQQKPQPIIHCDLKPENILLKNQNRSGIRLIDFGSACYADRRIHHYIQSRFYRSPEVILDLDYGTAIDRWSLGCVLVELHTGVPLFDGRSEAEQLARFESVLGPLPTDMIASSSKALKYYNLTPQGTYELKEPPQERRSLESILGMTADALHSKRKDCPDHDEASCRTFLDFIFALLKYRPQERISCTDALHHPFFSSLLSIKLGLTAPAGAGQVPTTTT